MAPKRSKPSKKKPALEAEVLPAEPDGQTNHDEDSSVVENVAASDIDFDVLPAEAESEDSAEDKKPVSIKDLVSYNPLDIYLREVNRLPQISREEEKALAIRYVKNKDVDAARQLIQSNLWLVVKIARDYQDAARNLLDLIQEGNMGLMEAVKNFDPFREVRFPSYAMWWIKAYVVRYLIANFRLVKVGTTQAQRKLFFNLRKEKERLEREGFFPAPKLLAEKLNVKESEVIEMEQRLGSPDVSVDAPLGEDGDGDLLSVMSSGSLTAEELLSRRQLLDSLNENLTEFEKLLNEKEKSIFKERLLSEDKVTLQELSDKYGVSKERIRQIEVRVMDKLKSFLMERMGHALETRDFEV